eukprot:Skav203072  [mRNA]  locus=scaffold363:90919:100073:- [translate_table: standard]
MEQRLSILCAMRRALAACFTLALISGITRSFVGVRWRRELREPSGKAASFSSLPWPRLSQPSNWNGSVGCHQLWSAVSAVAGVAIALRAYGGGRSVGSEAQYQMREAKRKREAAQFFTYQARLLRTGVPPRDDLYWRREERMLFNTTRMEKGFQQRFLVCPKPEAWEARFVLW